MTGLNIYANALHTIYKALDRHSLFSSFGFNLPESETKETSERTISNFDTWIYKPKLMDWENSETGKLFTEYEIDSYLEYILNNCIDK